ncbi:nucleotidyltransferase [Bacteroidia bacterium]|nr:nucleotidyltransferase [Bacteroidia bacterium]
MNKMKTTGEYINLLRDYKQNHASEYGIERIGIFGSVARGEQTENSDVDIYYEGAEKGLKSIGMIIELEELFGAKVDVIRRHRNMRPRFVERIMKDIIYV